MKTIMTTLAITMFITGCAEKERYAESYLDTISLVIHTDRPAEVTGFLKTGASPDQTVEYPDLSGVSRMSFSCGSEDSAVLFEQLPEARVPFSVSTGAYSSAEYWQEGITWQPGYSWVVNENHCEFSATVKINNSTGREWFSQNTIMKDISGNPVCMVSDTLIIRNGEMELGWWNASGEVLPLSLIYGWPVNAQWNKLVPCIVPNAGDLLMETGEWPLRTGDTLWVRPEETIEITEIIHQNTLGYECTLQLYNQTDEYTEIRISHPDILPRGALFQEEGNFPSILGLHPGDVVILEYRIRYNQTT